MSDLRRGALAPDADAIRSTAHALSGLLAGCGGVRASRAARQIEKAAEGGDLSNLSALLSDLQREFERLTQAVLLQRA
jgi:HPt (histidine-containing phosphotransfer) domain-containing protein